MEKGVIMERKKGQKSSLSDKKLREKALYYLDESPPNKWDKKYQCEIKNPRVYIRNKKGQLIKLFHDWKGFIPCHIDPKKIIINMKKRKNNPPEED